jgi:hypothetical protein
MRRFGEVDLLAVKWSRLSEKRSRKNANAVGKRRRVVTRRTMRLNVTWDVSLQETGVIRCRTFGNAPCAEIVVWPYAKAAF